jgi:hypothetical protein
MPMTSRKTVCRRHLEASFDRRPAKGHCTGGLDEQKIRHVVGCQLWLRTQRSRCRSESGRGQQKTPFGSHVVHLAGGRGCPCVTLAHYAAAQEVTNCSLHAEFRRRGHADQPLMSRPALRSEPMKNSASSERPSRTETSCRTYFTNSCAFSSSQTCSRSASIFRPPSPKIAAAIR